MQSFLFRPPICFGAPNSAKFFLITDMISIINVGPGMITIINIEVNTTNYSTTNINSNSLDAKSAGFRT